GRKKRFVAVVEISGEVRQNSPVKVWRTNEVETAVSFSLFGPFGGFSVLLCVTSRLDRPVEANRLGVVRWSDFTQLVTDDRLPVRPVRRSLNPPFFKSLAPISVHASPRRPSQDSHHWLRSYCYWAGV